MPPLKYWVPNGFTAFSLVLGLASMMSSAKGNFELAAWMILWGTLLDKLDGTAARLLRATSKFGVEFDSFADFVTFGIAPAALVYFRVSPLVTGWHGTALMVASAAYAVTLAVRLARFNTAPEDPKMFTGVPGTLAGAVMASGYLTWIAFGLAERWLSYFPAFLLILGALMVSNLRMPKLKLRKSRALNVFQFGNIAAAYIFGPLRLFPQYLFLLAMTYLVGGLLVGLRTPRDDDHDDGEPEESEEAQELLA